MPARYAVINADGTTNWSRDPGFVGATPAGTGRYSLEFRSPCDQDVFVIHAKTAGAGCDAPRVIVTAIQDGPTRICVAISNLANLADDVDAQFSYIRYPKADEFRTSGEGGEESVEGRCLPCHDAETRDWYAWINLMPPPPFELHVIGEILVPNPGVTPILVAKEPQGINPRMLLLDLYLRQEPGIWPQVQVWKQARYDKVLGEKQRYDAVQVFCGDTIIADIKVDEVH